MKKLLTLILAAGFYAMQGQEPLPATNQGPCSPTGVTTNPNNPQNPIPGHADFINWFDWTQSRFIFSVDNDNFTTSSLQSPFYINEGATSHFYVTPENPADNKPENGWELVSFHMGVDKDGDYDAENMGDIYFILYNKYRSLLRVFVAIEQNRDGNLIDIELRFKDKAYKTALFGALDEVQQPLKNFDPFTIASSAQVFDNSPTKRDWNYADFPVNYDPCTCQRVILEDGQSEPTDLGETELLLNVKIVDEAEINLEGTSQGNLNPIVEKDPGKTNGTDQWQDFYGPVKKIGTAIESGKKAYKTFKGFKGDVDKEVSGKSNASDVGTGFDNVAKLLTKEIPALDLVPYASEALAIVDYFVTGGKKEEALTVGPMSMNLEHSFSGNLWSTFPYIVDRGILVPGSEFTPAPIDMTLNNNGQPSRPLGDSRYPYYNEILGVYTLLEKPEVKVWRGITEEKDWDDDEQTASLGWDRKNIRHGLKITPGSIKVAINPSANLILREAYVQLNYTLAEQGYDRSAKFYNIALNDIVDDKSWTSDLIPLQSLAESALLFEVRAYNRPSQTFSYKDGELSCSMILIFENNRGDKFLHKSTWDTELIEIKNDYWDDFWDWTNSKFTENGVEPPTSDQWPFPGGDYGFNLAPENLEFLSSPWRPVNNGTTKVTFNNQVFSIPKPARLKAKNSIILKNIHTGGTGSTGSSPAFVWRFEDNFIAGSNITVENSTINPNTTLRISPIGITDPQPFNTKNIATAEEINSICESSTYLGNKRVNYKKESYLQEKPVTQPQINFSTYPNPAQESALIILEDARRYPAQLKISLLDISGNLVQRKFIKSTEINGNKYSLNLQGLAPGMYVVKVVSGNITGQQKILKL